MYLGDRVYFIRQVLGTNEQTLLQVKTEIGRYYRTFRIPKDGGMRTIRAVDRALPLYGLQKALCRNFLDKIPLPVPAVGFVRGESYLSFLKPHVGKTYFLRLDIRHFFDTITAEMICQQFAEFFPGGMSANLSDFLTLCTFEGRLPQGAVTSPAVSNVVFRRTDQRILKYCQSFDVLYRGGRKLPEDICYTRYADDLLFSSMHMDFSKEPYFAGMISRILSDAGFCLNREKTRYGRGEIALSGFVVSRNNVHLSRGKLHTISHLLHFLGKTETYSSQKYRVRREFFQEPDWLDQINGLALPDGRGGTRYFGSARAFLNYLCGCRALLLSVVRENPAEDPGMRQLQVKLRKLELVIDCVLKDEQML